MAAVAIVRPYHPADLDALYRVCLETGDAGRDATALYDDPTLLGHVYAAPYALFEPELASNLTTIIQGLVVLVVSADVLVLGLLLRGRGLLPGRRRAAPEAEA